MLPHGRSRFRQPACQSPKALAMTDFDPTSVGWTAIAEDPMPGGLGTSWRKRHGDRWIYGLQTRRDHANRAGAVHGGILVAFADHTLGCYVEAAADGAPNVTIQLNTHFLAAVEPGEFLVLSGEVTRAAGSMVFVRSIIAVGKRDVLAIDGIWRVFRPR
jgi:acyl-coenzyme A thioesterase PaaI-like protein